MGASNTVALLSALLLLSSRVAQPRRLSQGAPRDGVPGLSEDSTAEVQQVERPFTIDSDDITFGGSGCPQDSVQVVAAPSGHTISVIFDSFSASTADGDNRDRKSCNLALPIKVPNGVSIGIFQVDYRGYVSVPNDDDASARVRSEYFWAGVRGPVRSTVFAPGYDDDFSLTDRLSGEAIVWSPCGEDISFRINTSIYARKGGQDSGGDEVEISVDTTDVAVSGRQREAFLEARLVSRRCG
jgi:hypothetical protein